MLQRIHIAGNLFADRTIVGPDEDNLTVDDLEFVDARGVSCWDKIDDDAVEALEALARNVDLFGGRSFWRNHRDELESDRAVERAEAMGF